MVLSVFVIEDMQQVQQALAELLGKDRFKVIGAATTEAEANLWLEQNRNAWDVLIVDLVLEQGTGMRVIAKARANGNGHIVVFSSFATPGIETHCMRLGADAVFDKAEGTAALLAHCAALRRNDAARQL
ncbi:MAG TPA: response regulator [Ramlibacter sp.]|nr:response regulator [Ramlibacter sp.]